MKKLTISFLLLLTLAVSFSCKKNDDPKPGTTPGTNNTAGKCFVTKIMYGEDFSVDYTYNSAMEVTKITHKEDPAEEGFSYQFTRDVSGRITTLDFFEGKEKLGHGNLTYGIDNTLTKIDIFSMENGVPVNDFRLEFEHNSLKQLTKYKMVDPNSGLTENYMLLTYDTRGNVIKEERHRIEDGKDEIEEILEFEYDDKKNPMLVARMPFYMESATEISQNNVTRIIEKSPSGSTYSTTIAYQYNEQGYPKTSASGSNDETNTYEYICK